MLNLSNIDVAETLRAFSDAGVDCTFLVPTQTGLEKSILDATETVRAWLNENGVHNYSAQGQGQDNKVQIDSLIISGGQVVEATASLYRPETKSGDPRIWFGRLGQYADPSDLLAICKVGRKLLVVNCSKNDLRRLLTDHSSVFWRIVSAEMPANADLNPDAAELLSMLKQIAAKGYVPSMRSGDTGVGFTLETLLGIKCNSRKSPDYKGIELKAGRASSHASGRTSIFSQVPNWSLSRLKGSRDILRERGRFDEVKKRQQLNHSMSATKVNSYGLSLHVDNANEVLHQIYVADGFTTVDVTWRMETLFERLLEKHTQTFWIKADTLGKGVDEQFHYNQARYTSGVSPSKFPMLLEAGIITLDYIMKELPNGSAKDQGYPFKIKQADLPLLFKSPQSFDLLS